MSSSLRSRENPGGRPTESGAREHLPAPLRVSPRLSGWLCDLRRELRVLRHLIKPVRGDTHEERLESFYAGQADDYDAYRQRLLHGREDLIEAIAARMRESAGWAGTEPVWVDLGGGTGWSLEAMERAEQRARFHKIYLVDLSPSLLRVARARVHRYGWTNVELVHEDATLWRPPVGVKVSVVTFFYSLTMMPLWWSALENARDMLEPGGLLAAVDFHAGRRRQIFQSSPASWFQRSFWPLFFDLDDVHLSRDHVPYLHTRFEMLSCVERRGRMPYMPLLRAPFYRYVGTKRP